MPKLPGFESLGGVQTDASRPTGSYDVSPFARGAQALAQGAENLGRSVSQVSSDLAEVQRKHNEAQYLNATADTATGLANLHTSLQNDKDFSTLEQRYHEGAKAIVDAQAQTIPEGPLRAHYLAKSGELVAHGGGAINKQAYNGIVESDNLGLKVGLDNLTDDIAKNPGNPFRAAQVDALGLKIDNAVNQGWKTPEEATLLKRDIAVRVRTSELQVMATTDPENFLNKYGGSITRPRLAGVKGDESKPSMDPVDAAISPITMYHLINNAQTILIRRQNDELKLGNENAEKAASDAIARAGSPAGGQPIPGGRFSPEVNDAISKAAATTGVSENTLRRFAQIESSGRANAVTGSYKGLYQLSDAEFAKHGGGNVFNPADNAMAAATKLRGEALTFQQHNGRPATDADLYLIHNQGQGGYAAHMANPNAPAWQNMFSTAEGQVKGPRWAQEAIWGNIPDDPRTSPNFNKQMFPGGVTTVSSADFMRGWASKINGGNRGNDDASSTLASQRAAAVRDVMSNPNLNDKQRLYAAHQVEGQYAAWEMATNQNAKARTEASNQAADEWMTKLGNREGLETMPQDIMKDERMTWEARHTMSQFAVHVSGQPDTAEYGPGWLEAKKQVLAEPGDPKHIADPVDIVKRGLPGGDLTQAGVKDILETMKLARKSSDEHGVQSSKTALLTYAKSKLSFDQEMLFPGAPPLRDRRGEQIFNAQFVPKFNAAFNDWTNKHGKDPMAFLTQENVDKMLQGLRSPAQMKMDKLAASGESVPEQPGAPLPPTPEGIAPEAWVPLVSSPPPRADGKPFPAGIWAEALKRLAANPTPEVVAAFDRHFGEAGFSGEDIIKKLTAKPKNAAEEPAAAPEPKGMFSRLLDTAGGAVSGFVEGEKAKRRSAGAEPAPEESSHFGSFIEGERAKQRGATAPPPTTQFPPAQSLELRSPEVERQLSDLDRQEREAKALPEGKERRRRIERIEQNRDFYLKEAGR